MTEAEEGGRSRKQSRAGRAGISPLELTRSSPSKRMRSGRSQYLFQPCVAVKDSTVEAMTNGNSLNIALPLVPYGLEEGERPASSIH